MADIVFVGRAESADPDYDPWDPATAKQAEEQFPDSHLSGAESNRSPEQLARLKVYLSRFYSGERRDRIARASTFDEVEKVMDEGKRVTFTVLTRYKGLPDSVRQTDVWTDFSDCGAYFLKGETYLVYARRADDGRIGNGTRRTSRPSGRLKVTFLIEDAQRVVARTESIKSEFPVPVRPGQRLRPGRA